MGRLAPRVTFVCTEIVSTFREVGEVLVEVTQMCAKPAKHGAIPRCEYHREAPK